MRLLLLSTLIVWVLALWAAVRLSRARGILQTFQGLITVIVSVGIAGLLSVVLLMSHLLQGFARETLVARVTTSHVAPDTFQLTYLPASVPAAAARTFEFHGDQWAISGGIVKWHPWLTALGVPSYHKPTRLTGRFNNPERERAVPPTVVVLDAGVDRFWEGWFRIGPWLPFVEAVYGASAYVFVEPRMTAEVYVTPSGYLIKRVPRTTLF